MTSNDSPDSTRSIPSPSDPGERAQRLRAHADTDPRQIGPYKILQTLGEGGMGVVYLAEQERPIHRRVALKIIKLGMDTKNVIARFETEREALALMNHPNVAKVFDAGATDTGRPYFVMEYVPGIPITDYCDKHRLTTAERLLLFIDVCNAIQHAHQKGIIHRDIKPSNVLVSLATEPRSHEGKTEEARKDGSPAAGGTEVKVIDFGVAKATQRRLTERTLFTEQGQLIGTPGYMSPEQAEMTALDIDTRTDIYSLGVLLYELLVGSRPFDDNTLLHAGLAEIQRVIREVDPPKPSTRFSSLGAESTAIAHKRHTEVRTLSRQLRGDLDWIIMKCLEKDRTRRYGAANGLALDIERYLTHQPVLARAPSPGYRVRKFIRRNRAVVLSIAGVFFVLIAASAGTGLMYVRAAQARDEAEAVTDFLADTLAAADPGKQGKDVTVREVLDSAANRIGKEFAGQPVLEARLRDTIGWTYRSLGLLDVAQTHLSDAAAIYDRELGPGNPRALVARRRQAVVTGEQGRISEAETMQRSVLDATRSLLGSEHPDTLRAMSSLAVSIHAAGRYAEAETLHRQVLEIRRRVLGEQHPETLGAMSNLANSIRDQGRSTEADTLNRTTLDIQRRVLGDEHPQTLKSMTTVAEGYRLEGRYAEAEDLLRQTVQIRQRVLGRDHPVTLSSLTKLAINLHDQGRDAEAELLERTALGIQRRLLGDEHPDTILTMHSLALSVLAQGRFADAEQLAHAALGLRRRVSGEEHPDTLLLMVHLAASLEYQGRHTEADRLLRKALAVQRRVLGHEHVDTLGSMATLALCLGKKGEHAEAEELLRTVVEIQGRVFGERHASTLNSLNYLADVIRASGRFADAEPLARRAMSAAVGRDRAIYATTLGEILMGLGRHAEAETLLQDAFTQLSDDPLSSEIAKCVVELYQSWDAAELGKGYAEKAAEWRAKLEELKAAQPPRDAQPAPVSDDEATRNNDEG